MNTTLADISTLVPPVLALALGVLVCFFGHRLLKVVLGLVGFAAGAVAAGGLALLLSSGTQIVLLVASLIGGVLGTLILLWAFKVGVFLVGACGGVLLGGVLSASVSGVVQLVVIGVLALLGGLLAFRLQRVVIGLATAVIGASVMVSFGLHVILGFEPAKELVTEIAGGSNLGQEGWIALGSWLVLSMVGAGVQLSRMKKSKK